MTHNDVELLGTTAKAWHARFNDGFEAWIPKSVAELIEVLGSDKVTISIEDAWEERVLYRERLRDSTGQTGVGIPLKRDRLPHVMGPDVATCHAEWVAAHALKADGPNLLLGDGELVAACASDVYAGTIAAILRGYVELAADYTALHKWALASRRRRGRKAT